MQSLAAPARPRCAGALVFLLLFLGCKDSPLTREQQLDVGHDTVTISGKADIRDITVKSATGTDFQPAAVTAKPGDVLRFVTADARTHVISFEVPVEARSVFEAKTQMRSPPLLQQGVTWIVSLEGAPRGEYRYRCETHGYGGRVTVK